MKKLVVLAALLLTGCSATSSFTSKVKSYLPKQHDPVMAMFYVDTKIAITNLDCKKIDNKWDIAFVNAQKLSEYSTFRKDPQKDNTKAIETNLAKAKDNSVTCDNYLKIAKLRLEVLDKAWSTR